LACVILGCFEKFLDDPYYEPLPWFMIGKIMGPVHLPKQPPSVDKGYLHNNSVNECNVPCNEVSHINFVLSLLDINRLFS